MLKVGLTGGLASGKTFVASCFEDLGARVIHADKIGHETLAPDGEAYRDVVREFGEGILTADDVIDRKALGRIVFADSAKLTRLNALIHPHVFRREQEFFDQLEREDPGAVGVVEAAILIEAGSYVGYDRIVLAYCPTEVQIERFIERAAAAGRPATREDALARLEQQMPLDEKRRYADYLIDTSGSMEQTRERAAEVYVKLREEAL